MDEDDLTSLSSDALSTCLENLPSIEAGSSAYESVLFTLFLYFNEPSKKFAFVSLIIEAIKGIQIITSMNSFYIALNLLNGDNFLIIKIFHLFIEFYLPTGTEPPDFLYIAIMQFLAIITIVIFIFDLLLLYTKKPMSRLLQYLSYFAVIELARILLIPHCVIAMRAVCLYIVGSSVGNPLFAGFECTIALFLFWIHHCSSLFTFSMLSGSGERAICYSLMEPHLQTTFLVIIAWVLLIFCTVEQMKYTLIVANFINSIFYFITACTSPFIAKMENYVTWGFFGTMFFVSVSSLATTLTNFANYFILVYMSIAAFFVFLVASKLISIILEKNRRNNLLNCKTLEDIHFKNNIDFLAYFSQAIELHHTFVYNGKFIEYALENFRDYRTKFTFLRYALLLPLETPHLIDLEQEISAHNLNSHYIQFRIFEYQTIQHWRLDEMSQEYKDKLFKAKQVVHTFFKTASTFATFISQEDRKSTFLFGQALYKIETRLESHIQHWLLLHPTRLSVLKMAADFYEIAAIDKQFSQELKQTIQAVKVYSEDLPNFREMSFKAKSPITFSQLTHSSENSRATTTLTLEEYNTSNSFGQEKVITGDLFSSETKMYRTISFLVMFFFAASVCVLICISLLIFYRNRTDFSTLTQTIRIYSEHTIDLSNMIAYVFHALIHHEAYTEEQWEACDGAITGFYNNFNDL